MDGKKIKTTILFRPNPGKKDQVTLQKYLSGLDAGISGASIDALKKYYLPIAMIEAGNYDKSEVSRAIDQSIIGLAAQIETIRQMGVRFGINDIPAKPETTHLSAAKSPITQITMPQNDEDDWDDEPITSKKIKINLDN